MEATVQTGDPEGAGGEEVQGASASKMVVMEHHHQHHHQQHQALPYLAPLTSPSVSLASSASSSSTTSSSSSASIRLVLQQCMSAQLMVQPSMEGVNPQFVEIQRGLIIYVCFLRGATKAQVEKIAKMALSVRLSEGDNGKLVSVFDLPGDILIIPQATLGGTLKGKVMQYHKNIPKDRGQQLYSEFVSVFQKTYERSEKCMSAGAVVRYGTYGNRQVFSCQTNGPYTHMIEL